MHDVLLGNMYGNPNPLKTSYPIMLLLNYNTPSLPPLSSSVFGELTLNLVNVCNNTVRFLTHVETGCPICQDWLLFLAW